MKSHIRLTSAQTAERRMMMRMRCPHCGTKLKADIYRGYPKKGELAFCLYCKRRDFGIDYTPPSKAIDEVKSAYRRNDTTPKGEWE